MAYVYPPGLVFNEATMQPAADATGTFYDVPFGTVYPVTDLQGTPLANITTNSMGFFTSFKTATGPSVGWLLFGTYWHPVTSVEAQNGAASVAIAQTASDAATDAAAEASQASSDAASAAAAASAASVVAQAQPGMAVVVQNVDNTWPDRRTVTTARNKIIGWLYRNADDSTWPAAAAIDATAEVDLAKPTPADLFAAYNPA